MLNKIHIPEYLPDDALQKDLDSNENYNDFNVRFFHRQRVNIFLKTINSLPKVDMALDIGCGAGTYTRLLLGFASRVYAIDVKKNNKLKNQFIQMDVQKMGFKKNNFGFVICSEVLEHIDNVEDSLNEIFRILKPGGIVLFSMPNAVSALWLRNRFRFNMSHLFNKNLSAKEIEYKKHIEFMPSRVIRSLRKIGFKILRTSGCFAFPVPAKVLAFHAKNFPGIAYKICKIDTFLTNSYLKKYGSYTFVLCIKE